MSDLRERALALAHDLIDISNELKIGGAGGYGTKVQEAAAIIRALLALVPNLASARTAGDDSQNTAAQMTQSVDVASESVAGRAPVAQSGEQAAFEAWYAQTYDEIRKHEDGTYQFHMGVQWEAWQARAAAPIVDEARDAARYRWLRNPKRMHTIMVQRFGPYPYDLHGEMLDQQVDAAIAAERGDVEQERKP